jgi:hypothetical protein
LNRIWFSWIDDINTGIAFLTFFTVSLFLHTYPFIVYVSVLFLDTYLAWIVERAKIRYRFAPMGKLLKQRQPMALLPVIFGFTRRVVKPVLTVLLQFLLGHKVLHIGNHWSWNSWFIFLHTKNHRIWSFSVVVLANTPSGPF